MEQPMVSPTTPRCYAPPLALLVMMGLGLGGCQTAGTTARPTTPAELVKAEDDLLRPFRSSSIVIADQVVMQISPNFYAKIGRPPGGVRKKGSNADEILWSVRDPVVRRQQGEHASPGNSAGVAVPVGVSEMEFVIEGTIFLVTNSLRMRVLHTAPPTMQIAATGDVRLLTERAMKEQLFTELRFNQGKVHGKRRQR
jgi:hypothetical protein